MKDQPPEHSTVERPRWEVRIAAGTCALLYACVFLGANIAPRHGAIHGWPFAYMARELRVFGDITVYHGPWPHDNPPLVAFRPGALAWDVIVGVALSFAAAASVVYWLRTSRWHPTFGLRTALGCMTVVAILAAIDRAVVQLRDPTEVMWRVLFCLLGASSCLVYTAPVCLVITVAHWIVLHSASSPRRRRWCGLHWLTWFALAATGGPFLHYAFFGCSGGLCVGRERLPGYIVLTLYGWPFRYLGGYEPAADRLAMTAEGFPVSYFDPFALTGDLFAAIVFIAAIAFVIERWIRRTERGVRIRRRTVISLLVAGAGVMVVLHVDHWFRPSSYAYPSCLFAVASAISAALEVFVIGIKRLVRRWPRNSTTAA